MLTYTTRNGFTILELMSSLTILFVLCAIAYPNFSAARAQLRASEDARTVVLVLGELRAEAIRLKRPMRINFTESSVSWDIYDDGTDDGEYVFNGGTTWRVIPADIVFNGFGLARGVGAETTMTLSHGTYSYGIKINSNGHVDL